MNVADNDFFKTNLRLLSLNNDQLAFALEKLDVPSSITVFPSASGLMTAKVKSSPDCGKYIHSSVNPSKEATHWAAMQKTDSNIFVLMGMGLGYPAIALLENGYSGELLIVEKEAGIFKLALQHCDLSRILINKNVFLLIGDKSAALSDYLPKGNGSLSYGIYQPAGSLHNEFYERLSIDLDKIIFKKHNMNDPQGSAEMEILLQLMKE